MKPSVRMGQVAPWLVALSAVALLVLVKTMQEGDSRQAVGEKTRLTARIEPRRSFSRPARASALQPAVAASYVSRSKAAFGEVDVMDHFDGRRDDPQFAFLWHRQQQRIIEKQYGYAIASLNLSAGDSAKLTELLTARREAVVDARDVAEKMGIVGPQANVAVQQSVDALTGEIKGLVGSDAYFNRLELAPTISTCKALLDGTVGLDLAASGSPLTTEQSYGLAEDYVEASYSPRASMGPQDPDPATGLTPQFQALLDKEAGKLSEAQAAAFRTFLVEQIQMLRITDPASPAKGDDY